MTLRLTALRDCFEGVIPSIIATLDASGDPNISYLSQVYLVDDEHVALSNQFFTKTAANVRATGRATTLVVDGRTGEQYRLGLAFLRSLEDGELFERMAAHLRALSSQHGVDHIMKLRSADLYRVLDLCAVPSPHAAARPETVLRPRPVESLARAAQLGARLAAETNPETLVDVALDGLRTDFDADGAMLLVPDETEAQLVTLGSRGYGRAGVGSEIPYGQESAGIAAATARPVRLSEMSRGRRFAEAVRTTAELEAARVIALPRLPEVQSQVAAPMIVQGRLYGVLLLESGRRFQFTREDEDALVLIGAQLAAGLRLAEMEAGAEATARQAAAQPLASGPVFDVKCFTFDDSVFIDGAYVIKGVPGRLLMHFLRAYVETGRREFSNREIRLDPSLRLPDLKDNLETRLILLRRRLEEKAAPVQLSRPGRGRIRLEADGLPQLSFVQPG